jgi:hypothetical protein
VSSTSVPLPGRQQLKNALALACHVERDARLFACSLARAARYRRCRLSGSGLRRQAGSAVVAIVWLTGLTGWLHPWPHISSQQTSKQNQSSLQPALKWRLSRRTVSASPRAGRQMEAGPERSTAKYLHKDAQALAEVDRSRSQAGAARDSLLPYWLLFWRVGRAAGAVTVNASSATRANEVTTGLYVTVSAGRKR